MSRLAPPRFMICHRSTIIRIAVTNQCHLLRSVSMHPKSIFGLLLSALLMATVLNAQAPADSNAPTRRDPTVVSPQVLSDRRVIVRLYAPQARQVSVTGIVTPAVNLSKGDGGVWDATLGPVDPGAYRY